MRYFFDTEFIEDGRTIDLLSIGIVAEDGRELYAEVDPIDVDHYKADPWIKENVIDRLWHRQPDKSEFNKWIRDGGRGGLLSRSEIASEIRRFCTTDLCGHEAHKPEFWAFYADYDWVVLCQLFGRMVDLPDGWPRYCNDVKQFAMALGNPRLPPQMSTLHHALEDARWTKRAYEFLQDKI